MQQWKYLGEGQKNEKQSLQSHIACKSMHQSDLRRETCISIMKGSSILIFTDFKIKPTWRNITSRAINQEIWGSCWFLWGLGDLGFCFALLLSMTLNKAWKFLMGFTVMNWRLMQNLICSDCNWYKNHSTLLGYSLVSHNNTYYLECAMTYSRGYCTEFIHYTLK